MELISDPAVTERIERFAGTIRRRVQPGGAVLEIGAGSGQLAQALLRDGYDVCAIDKNPSGDFPTVSTTFEAFNAGSVRFDCVAAQCVLHHAAQLEEFVTRISRMLKPCGVVAIDDYGWERSSDPAFRESRADLHTSSRMVDALDRVFDRIVYFDQSHVWNDETIPGLGFCYIGMLPESGALRD